MYSIRMMEANKFALTTEFKIYIMAEVTKLEIENFLNG